MKHLLLCRFCGKECGTVDLPDYKYPKGVLVVNDMLGVEDVRCEDCQNLNGTYQECWEIFCQEKFCRKIDGTEDMDLFRKMMEKAGYKKKKFIAEVEARRSVI